MPTPIQVFCCYAYEDKSLLVKLKAHLAPFRQTGSISIWDDCDITPGTIREKRIQEQLKAAQVILLLISPDFISSNYCYSIEMKQALERHERDEARVIPIILRPTHWQKVPVLNGLQALPTCTKPITDRYWQDQDEAFYDITMGIDTVINELQAKQKNTTLTDTSRNDNKTALENVVTGHIEQEGRLVKGADDFIRHIETTPETARLLLQKLCDWAVSLEQAQLVQLYTYHSKGGALTLLPRLKVDDAGLVSIYNNHGTISIQFWRSVFERRAPEALTAIERSITPIKQGNRSHEVSNDLLEMLTEAYREAVR